MREGKTGGCRRNGTRKLEQRPRRREKQEKKGKLEQRPRRR